MRQVGHLGRSQHRHDHVHLLVGLTGHRHTEAVHHTGADLGTDVGGQAVQVQRVARPVGAGERHPPLVADPVAVLGVARQRAGLDVAHRCLVARSVGGHPLGHQRVRAPRLGVHGLGTGERIVHVVGDTERTARRRGAVGGPLHRLGQQLVPLRMGEGDVGAEAGEQADDALGHRQRLGVAGRVGPAHGDAAALDGAAEVLAQPQQVGQRLGGVIDVALQVDHRHHPRIVAGHQVVGDAAQHVAHEAVALAEDQVVAHPQRVGVHAQHRAGLLGGLSVRHLRGRPVDDDRLHAQPGRGAGPGRFRARGVVEEHRIGELVGQEGGGGPCPVEGFQAGRHGQQCVEIGSRPVVRGQQAAAAQRIDAVAIGE